MLKKLKHWYTKPRKGFVFDVMDYALYDPEALNITMIMGHIVTILVFFVIGLICFIYVHPLLGMVFGVIALHSMWKCYNHFKIGKQTGGITKYYKMSMYDLVYGGNENVRNGQESNGGNAKVRQDPTKGFSGYKRKSKRIS